MPRSVVTYVSAGPMFLLTKLIVNVHFDNSPGSSIRIRTERCTWGR
jgi:hypothetical protein